MKMKKIMTFVATALVVVACGEHEGHDHNGKVCTSKHNDTKVNQKADDHSNCGDDHSKDVVKEEKAPHAHDHSIEAAKNIGSVTFNNIKFDVLQVCTASFAIKTNAKNLENISIRGCIINSKGEESIITKAHSKESGLWSLDVEEAPALDNAYLHLTMSKDKVNATTILKL